MANDPTYQVKVHIHDRDYTIGCREDEQDILVESAAFVNEKMGTVRAAGKVVGTERVAVMAALNIAYELLQTQQDATINQEQFDDRRGLGAGVAPRPGSLYGPDSVCPTGPFLHRRQDYACRLSQPQECANRNIRDILQVLRIEGELVVFSPVRQRLNPAKADLHKHIAVHRLVRPNRSFCVAIRELLHRYSGSFLILIHGISP